MRTTLWLASILGLMVAREVSAAPGIYLFKEQSVIKVSANGRPMFEYQFAPATAFKPYIFQLFSPGGVAVLRDAVPDHVHHHGLMFALQVNEVTFWEEKNKNNDIGGRQLPRQTDVRGDRIVQQLDWQGTNGAVLLRETRTIQPLANPNVTLLTWRDRLETPPGTNVVTLSGHHYYGLGARLLQSMDKTSTFVNSSGVPGEIVRGDEHLVPASWVAGTGPTADGRLVTIAIFDYPGNLRYPAKKFTMATPFAYLSTTLNLWKEPFLLKAGEPLELCYGVAVWDGKIDASQIEQTCQQWQKLAR